MKTLVLELPTLGFVVATRAALGVGIGLLASEALPLARRRAIGAALVALGAATTIPAVLKLRRGLRAGESRNEPPSVARFARTGNDAD